MNFKRSRFFAHSTAFLLLFFFSSCTKQINNPESTTEPGSFATLQEKVFDLHCATAGCHNSVSRSGGLELEASVSFANLINISPNNTAGREAGYKLIRPSRPDSSFLYLKTDQTVDHEFGERMPYGSNSRMSPSAREFVREWITAGAPQSGFVANEALLAQSILAPIEFTPPAPPVQGVQLRLNPFTINGGAEREIFVYDRLSNTDTIYVRGVDIAMREGSHHFILYKYSQTDLPLGQMRDLTIGTVLQEMSRSREFLIGAQTPSLSYDFPENVVLPLAPRQGFDLNSHYVNKGSGILNGEVYVNLRTVPKSDNLIVAEALFDNFLDVVLPPVQPTLVERSVLFDSPRNVVMFSSHTHKRGRSFKIYLVGGPDNGKLVYENYSWDHPPTKTFSPPLRFESGWGYRIVAEYVNETSRTIRFGFTSEDEMCIALGYYYQ